MQEMCCFWFIGMNKNYYHSLRSHINTIYSYDLGTVTAQIFDASSTIDENNNNNNNIIRDSLRYELKGNSGYLIIASKILRPNTFYQVSSAHILL